MLLLTNSAPIYLNGSPTRTTFKLYKTSSAQNHKTADDTTLKQALMAALSKPIGPDKTQQEPNVFRVKINSGIGYLVYKLGVAGPDSAAIFHYHWNYTLDLPLTAM